MVSSWLSNQVCKRITPLLHIDQNSDSSPIMDVGSCVQHRSVLVQMSAIIQAVVLHCPAAVVWNYVGEGKISSHLIGSPLDHLPVQPSTLPMAPRFSNDHVFTYYLLLTYTKWLTKTRTRKLWKICFHHGIVVIPILSFDNWAGIGIQ